ncbi:ASCH domain-containing protein [Pedobacter antarcticus]|nr:ASCH domain-containing protein [Pedobacter antarcticus]
MKALTIKNPWALLIAQGIKDIENRTWRTKFRGSINIHAGKDYPYVSLTDQQEDLIRGDLRYNFIKRKFNCSAIIVEVDIVDCVLNHESIWAEQMAYDVCPETGMHILRKGQPYVWNWVLANPLLYDKPIENVKGALSVWEPFLNK